VLGHVDVKGYAERGGNGVNVLKKNWGNPVEMN